MDQQLSIADISFYSLENIDNYIDNENINYKDYDILLKYNLLITEYFNFIAENISCSTSLNANYIRFIILRGFETISHIFFILLNYTKNLEMTYYHCQKAFYYYVEFIGQITDDSHSYLQLNSRDACMYVYKKTIFEIKNDVRNKIKPCKEIEFFYKKMLILKNVIYYNINHFSSFSGSNKEEFIKNIDFLCLKLSNQKLNDKLLEQIHLYIENINTGYDVDFIKYFYNIDNFIKSILRHASTS